MTPTPTLAISIINFRTADLTVNCLMSLLADIGPRAVEIAIVDNASGDGSDQVIADWIDTHHPPDHPTKIRLIRSAANSGFSGGHNQGINATTADWVLVLNSDSLVRPGMLSALLKALQEAPADQGLLATRLEWEDETVQISTFRFPTPQSELIRGAMTGPVTRMFKHREVALSTRPDPAQIEWASFASIALRRQMIDAIGPMDEGYFLYFEDAEYCLRARRAGWRVGYAPSVRVVHLRGGSGPVKALAQARKRLPAYYYSSRSRFFYQAHGRFGLLAANTLWYLGRVIAHSRMLLRRNVPRAADREARDIWINALHPLRPHSTQDDAA
jgi:hypothetical protein